MLNTANAIKGLHCGLSKSDVMRGHYPHDKVAANLQYLAIRNIEKNWKAPVEEQCQALNQSHILIEDKLQGMI